MTFKRELKEIRKSRKKNKIKRTKYEKILIGEFIKQRLRIEASKGRKSADFPIIGHEVIINPITDESIYIEKSDYKAFAFRHRLRYEIKRDWYYKEPNKITIFF